MLQAWLQVLYYVIPSESIYRKTISDKKEINLFADITQNSETEKVPREIINIEFFVKHCNPLHSLYFYNVNMELWKSLGLQFPNI